jgi:hypothetical protein
MDTIHFTKRKVMGGSELIRDLEFKTPGDKVLETYRGYSSFGNKLSTPFPYSLITAMPPPWSVFSVSKFKCIPLVFLTVKVEQFAGLCFKKQKYIHPNYDTIK